MPIQQHLCPVMYKNITTDIKVQHILLIVKNTYNYNTCTMYIRTELHTQICQHCTAYTIQVTTGLLLLLLTTSHHRCLQASRNPMFNSYHITVCTNIRLRCTHVYGKWSLSSFFLTDHEQVCRLTVPLPTLSTILAVLHTDPCISGSQQTNESHFLTGAVVEQMAFIVAVINTINIHSL